MGGCLWEGNDYHAGDDDGDGLAKGGDAADSAANVERTVTADNKEQDDGHTMLADNGDKGYGANSRGEDEGHVATTCTAGDRGDYDDDAAVSADKDEKTFTADNKEQDAGGSLLADNGEKDHGAGVSDKDEVLGETNAGDRGDYDDDAVTAGRATGESVKCGDVGFLVSDFFCLCVLILFCTK